ncbi:DUF4179 domain-containing protein [Neobacillus sp. KR4-4]|uniref:DUF4179 domain-containing protein n=1 Tax=Neobacillus sp. KR4-4 TaxID=3344872 RepID=UPI0035CB5DAC
MKDFYELINDFNIDESEFEELEVTEFEKAQVKKSLKKSIVNHKKRNSWKKNVVVASILFCISATTFGLTLPVYAKNIPVIDDIFRFFDNGMTGIYTNKDSQSKVSTDKGNGLYSDYKKYSSDVNLTKESNGVKFTINDAVFDGKTVTLTYSIESNQDLGNAGISMPKIRGMKALGGTGKTSKINSNKYVGILTVSDLENKKLDVANIQWDIDSIKNPDNQTEIKGDWKFAFSLNATNNRIQLTEGSAEKNGVKVNIEKITTNPMSFTVYYNQEISSMVKSIWDGVLVDLEIRDDLGNSYSGQDNGASGDNYNVYGGKTFGKLNEKAKKLIITPHVTFIDYNSNNSASVQITANGVKNIPLPEKPGKGKKEFTLKDIVVELKK